MYVQGTDECYFNGKKPTGKQALRDREPPPEHCYPVYTAGVKHIVKTIRSEFEVDEAEIKRELSA
jgi:hypothetical protein